MLACSCDVCTSSNPKNKRFRTSAFITHDDFQFIIDTTPDLRMQCLREDIRRIDTVLYTHEHSDHLLGLDELRRYCTLQKKRMPVYGSPNVLEYIRRIFPYTIVQPPPYPGLPELNLHEITGPLKLGKLTVTPFEMPHGLTKTFGFRFDDDQGPRFAYLTDGKIISSEIKRAIRNIPVLVLGALRDMPHPTHLSISEALQVVEDVQPGKTFFVHMSHEVEHDEVESRLPNNVRLAYDGLTVEI